MSGELAISRETVRERTRARGGRRRRGRPRVPVVSCDRPARGDRAAQGDRAAAVKESGPYEPGPGAVSGPVSVSRRPLTPRTRARTRLGPAAVARPTARRSRRPDQPPRACTSFMMVRICGADAVAEAAVLLAADDPQEPVRFAHPEVTRAEPALPQGLFGRVGPLPVALHHVVAADGDLAGGPVGQLAPLVVLHTDAYAVDRQPDGARTARPLGAVQAGDRGGLGQAVALQQRAAEGLLEGVQDLHRQRRATGRGQPQPPSVRVRQSRVGEQRPEHRGDALEDRDVVPEQHLQCPARVEARQQGQARPGRHRAVEGTRLAEGVEEGQPAEDDVVRRQPQQRGVGRLHVVQQVVVGEFGPLGAVGRAGGVDDDRRVVRIALDGLRERLVPVRAVAESTSNRAPESARQCSTARSLSSGFTGTTCRRCAALSSV